MLAFVLAACASAAAAQGWSAPAPGPELQAALQKANGGDPAALTALADAGDPGAQYYAAVLYVFGRGQIAPDGARGCAYAEKASATRADAMHLVGRCYQSGASGQKDPAKAEAAYMRAAEMGFAKSKCALGQMLMADPAQAPRGLGLCREAADAGDADAQAAVGDAYFSGAGAPRDHAEARRWYEMAAAQNDPDAARRLGEMYARGDGGKQDTKKAIALWQGAEKAGDPMAAILVADQLFSDMTGGKTPGPGRYAFKGGVPVGDIDAITAWYQEAAQNDPRPEVRQRANYALAILASIKKGAEAAR
jgi:TPR repeat protein